MRTHIQRIVTAAVLLVAIGLLVFWLVKPGAEAVPIPSPTASDAPTEMVTLVLDSDTKSGAATQEVTVGKNVAAITVHFDYDLQGDDKVVTDIGPATAEKRAGWHHVERTATIDQDKIIYANEGAQAAVPVTYQASIGAGNVSYDYVVVIDLSEA